MKTHLNLVGVHPEPMRVNPCATIITQIPLPQSRDTNYIMDQNSQAENLQVPS
jgi:hypothetical protein